MHNGTGPAIVHALKYAGWHAVAREMAERMARLAWPLDVLEERAALLPVPLSQSRERERGFNQSERLARALGERWRIPLWCDVLERARSTETQTRLTPEERLANVSGAFRVRDVVGRLRNAHVVLVDDVVTTAATLNACAAALCSGGARIVSYVTFGRAPAVGDR
jgi:ComF family protein